MRKNKLIKAICIITLIACTTLTLASCNPKSYGYTVTKTSVYTPKGSCVVGGIISELTSADYNSLNNQTSENFPNAVKKREPTNSYNCHSYAWYSQSASNNVWIGLEIEGVNYMGEQKKYWTDGSYIMIKSGQGDTIPAGIPNGSKVDYSNADHSAIKTSNTKFTSKWGAAGLFEHSPSYCPYTSTNLNYYKYYKD